MPQLRFPNLTDEEVRNPVILNRLIARIKNAYDVMRTNNFGSGIIPQSSLEMGQSYVPIVLRYNGPVGPGAGAFNVDLCQIPSIEGSSDEGMELVYLWAMCKVIGGAASDVTVDIYKYVAGDALVGTLTLKFSDPSPQKDNAVVSPGVVFNDTNLIRMVVNCPAGVTCDTPTVVALFMVNHAS
jgi:hypothetical protein